MLVTRILYQQIHCKVKNTFQFKTNINCSGCVAKVKTVLDNASGICHWHVDTFDARRLLTVHSKGISEDEIIKVVGEQGFKIEKNE